MSMMKIKHGAFGFQGQKLFPVATKTHKIAIYAEWKLLSRPFIMNRVFWFYSCMCMTKINIWNLWIQRIAERRAQDQTLFPSPPILQFHTHLFTL